MCKCHEEGYECFQGRKCPHRMPVQFAGDEPYTTMTFVIAIVLVFLIISGAFFFAR